MPVVIVDSDPRGRRVVAACSVEARRHGIRPGQSAVEAETAIEAAARSAPRPLQAMFVPGDAAADLQMLHAIADRCRTLTPLVGCDVEAFPDSLLLDLTGCDDRLLEAAALARELRTILDDGTLYGRIAAAPGVHAAWALACYGPPPTVMLPRPASTAQPQHTHRGQGSEIEDAGDGLLQVAHPRWPLLLACEWPAARRLLLELPLAALRLDARIQTTLAELGLVTVGDVNALPRAELRRRFGPPVVHALQTLLGERPETFPGLAERPQFDRRLRWDFPVTDRGILQQHLEKAFEKLLQELQAARMVTQRFLLRFELEGHQATELAIVLATPTCALERILRVVALKLEGLHFPAGVCGMHIIAQHVRPRCEDTGGLFDRWPDSDPRALEMLADELLARLGPDAACRFVPVESHVPEQTFERTTLIDARGTSAAARRIGVRDEPRERSALPDPDVPEGPLRPVLVYRTPERLDVLKRDALGRPLQFRFRRRLFSVAAWSSEEAVQTGWWTPEPVERQYFRVHTFDGRCLWIYRSGDEWFLHGEFD